MSAGQFWFCCVHALNAGGRTDGRTSLTIHSYGMYGMVVAAHNTPGCKSGNLHKACSLPIFFLLS